MVIAIDVRDLHLATTGTRTVLDELVKSLPKAAAGHRVVLLEPLRPPHRPESRLSKIREHLSFVWWKEVTLPIKAWRAKADILFCTDYFVPLFTMRCETVPLFHGAEFWELPENYNPIWRLLLNWLAVPAARRSRYVVTVSRHSQRAISKHTGLDHDRIVPIHNAPKSDIRHRLPDASRQAVLRSYGVPVGAPYILHVGVMDKRKNLVRLIQAFAQSLDHIDRAYRLVLVGQPGPKRDMDDSRNVDAAIARYGLRERVIITGHVPDDQLVAFYQSATFYAFPSLNEGFGIPVVESFAADLPLMASRSASLPEVAGDAALFFDASSVEDIECAIVTMATDESIRLQLKVKGRQRLKHFSWEKAARELVSLFEVIHPPPP